MARPTKTPFTKQEIEYIKVMSGLGLPVEKIAAILGCSRATFHRRIKYSPGGVETLLRGRAEAEAHVTQALFDMAISKKCPAATIFWIKCRARWSEPREVEIPGDDITKKKTVTKYVTEWGNAAEPNTPGRDEES